MSEDVVKESTVSADCSGGLGKLMQSTAAQTEMGRDLSILSYLKIDP
jgi:hypothetical protein